MSLIDLRYRLEDIYAGLKMSLNRRRAVVTSVAPLQIRFELSDDPLAGTPDTQVWPLAVGDLVHVLVQNRRALIIGKVRGSGASLSNDLRGTSAQRVALGLSGVMQDGMRFFDTDEKREYVWLSGAWAGAWNNVAIPSGSGVCRWRRSGEKIRLEFNISYSTAIPAGGALAPGFTLPVAARPAVNTPIVIMGAGSREATGYVEASTGNSAIRNSSSVAKEAYFGWAEWDAAN